MSLKWWHPVLGEREREMVLKAIDCNFPNDGEFTQEFERRIALMAGAKYAVGVTSGTSALFLALLASGVRRDDEVLVPDLTFIATANAVRMVGARAVLVDVRRDDFGMDPERAAAAITPRTTAILPVHVNGRKASIEALVELARRHGLAVIEDAAEGFGSHPGGRALGTFGQSGCFSFAPSKIITTGQGGAIITSDDAVHARLRGLKDQGRPVRGTGGADDHPTLGFNFKLSNLLAAVGVAQLEQLDKRLGHIKDLYRWYRDALRGIPGLEVPRFDLEGGEMPQWIDVLVDRRDELAAYLESRGIETRKFWYPLHTQPPYHDAGQDFPAAIDVSARGLWLPSALSVSRTDVEHVAAAIHDFYERRLGVSGPARGVARASQRDLGIGVVGTGFGRIVHVPALAAVKGARIVGIASADPERSRQVARELSLPRAFASWKELVECPDVQAVTIATPPSAHEEVALAALAAGKAVLCEKPLAMDAAQAERMLRAARSAAVVHVVGFEFRELPALQLAREIVRSGDLGHLRHVNVNWVVNSWADAERRWSWRSDRERGGGTLGALGAHVFDYIEWIFGPVKTMSAHLSTLVPQRPDEEGHLRRVTAEDYCDLQMELHDGTPVNIVLSHVAPRGKGHRIEIYGESKLLIVGSENLSDYGRGFAVWESGVDSTRLRKIPVLESEAESDTQDGRVAPFSRLAERFVEAVRDTRYDVRPSFEDGVRVQVLLDVAQQAHEERRWIEVPAAQASSADGPFSPGRYYD